MASSCRIASLIIAAVFLVSVCTRADPVRQCSCSELAACEGPQQQHQPGRHRQCFQQCQSSIQASTRDQQAIMQCLAAAHAQREQQPRPHFDHSCIHQQMRSAMCAPNANTYIDDSETFGHHFGGRFGQGGAGAHFRDRMDATKHVPGAGGFGGRGGHFGRFRAFMGGAFGDQSAFKQCMRQCGGDHFGRFAQKAQCLKNLGCSLRRPVPGAFMQARTACGGGSSPGGFGAHHAQRHQAMCGCLVANGVANANQLCADSTPPSDAGNEAGPFFF